MQIYRNTVLSSLTLSVAVMASPLFGRSVFLNGKDISSARDQDLHHVEVRIDGTGNIFLEAEHYQVSEETQYTPLSSYLPPNRPKEGFATPSSPPQVPKSARGPLEAAKTPVEPVQFGKEPPSPQESAQVLKPVADETSQDKVADKKLLPKEGSPAPK